MEHTQQLAVLHGTLTQNQPLHRNFNLVHEYSELGYLFSERRAFEVWRGKRRKLVTFHIEHAC
jgi:hypothetical protein